MSGQSRVATGVPIRSLESRVRFAALIMMPIFCNQMLVLQMLHLVQLRNGVRSLN